MQRSPSATNLTMMRLVFGALAAAALLLGAPAFAAENEPPRGILVVVDDRDPDSLPLQSSAYREAFAALAAGLGQHGHQIFAPDTVLTPEARAAMARYPRNFEIGAYRNGVGKDYADRIDYLASLTMFATVRLDESGALSMAVRIEAAAYDFAGGNYVGHAAAAGPTGEQSRLPMDCYRDCVAATAGQFAGIAAAKLVAPLSAMLAANK